ncbi:MAG: glycosyltransferase [Chloroflexota bacterium]
MKIMIMTLGTRGDVQPYVALGKGLKERGHDVTVCTSGRFQPFIEQYGLTYGYMDDAVIALIDSEEVRAIMGGVTNLFGAVRAAFKMMGQVGPLQKKMIADTWQTTEKANPDLIIFHPKTYGATHFAEKLGIPSILAPTIPQFAATAEFPAFGFPSLPIGGWYNRLSYQLTVRLTVMGVAQYTNPWRKEHSLKKQSVGTDFMFNQAGEPITVIHPISNHVIDVPTDWPEYIHAKGYWFLEETADYSPPSDLIHFLENGPAPVYIGFGSMVGNNPQQLAQTIIEAIQKAGVRAVLAAGWGGLAVDQIPENIFLIDRAPHNWLFPQMAAVVHHGGAGTVAAGLKAGKPTLVCPYFGDQPYWGKQMQKLGVGPAPLLQKKLTADKLAARLVELTTNASFAQKAAIIGEKLRQEDGIGAAIGVIESVLGERVMV